MLVPCKGSGGPKQAGLRMGDEFDGERGHQRFKTALGTETLRKAGAQQMVLDAQAQPTGDDDARRALRQCDIPGHTAEREAKAIKRGAGQTIAPLQRERPHGLVIHRVDGSPFDGGERGVNIQEAWPGDDAFD